VGDAGSPFPQLGANVEAMSADTWTGMILNAIFKAPITEELFKKVAGSTALGVLTRATGFHPDRMIAMLRAARTTIERIKREADPYLLEFVVDGLNQYFGTSIGRISAREYGILGQPRGEEAQLGRAALTAMFQSVSHPAEITPTQGFDNAQRLINFALRSAIEGWLLKNTEELVALDAALPHWGELHDLVSQALGMGRLLRRVFAPLLNVLVVQPTTRQLNQAFLPAFYNEHQATHALHAGVIGETEYYTILRELGWSQQRAGVVRMTNMEHLGFGELERAWQTHLMTDDAIKQSLRLMGLTEDLARIVLGSWKLTRIHKIEDEVATAVRTMFAKREIDESEYRSALEAAGHTPEEVEGMLGLGRLEAARPTRPTLAQMQGALEEGLIDINRFRRFLVWEGYSLEDQILFEQISLKKKLAFEATQAKKKASPSPDEGLALPRAAAEELHRQGLMSDGELTAAYTALGFKGARVTMLLKLAQKRRDELVAAKAKKEAPKPGPLAPRAAMEDAFIRGVIDEARLVAFFHEEKLADADIQVVLADLRSKRADFEKHRADQAAKAKGPAGKAAPTLPRAAAEEAHRFGLMTSADLQAYYVKERFTPDSITQLMGLAEKRRADYVAALAKHQAPPKLVEPTRTTQELAFEHDLITEDELLAHYQDLGYDEEDQQLLLELARIRRDHTMQAHQAVKTAAAHASRTPHATTGG
jgi:hypothetical protein